MPRPKKKPISQRALEMYRRRFGDNFGNTPVYTGPVEHTGEYRQPSPQPKKLQQTPERKRSGTIEEAVQYYQDRFRGFGEKTNLSIVDAETKALEWRNRYAAARFISSVLPSLYPEELRIESDNSSNQFYTKPFANTRLARRIVIRDILPVRPIQPNAMGVDPEEEQRKREAAQFVTDYTNYRNQYIADAYYNDYGLTALLHQKGSHLYSSDSPEYIAARSVDYEMDEWAKAHPDQVKPIFLDFIPGMYLGRKLFEGATGLLEGATGFVNYLGNIPTQSDVAKQDVSNIATRELNARPADKSAAGLLNEYAALKRSLSAPIDEQGNIIAQPLFEGDPAVRRRVRDIEYDLRNMYGINLDSTQWDDFRIKRGSENTVGANGNVVSQQENNLILRDNTFLRLTDPSERNFDDYINRLPLLQQLNTRADVAERELRLRDAQYNSDLEEADTEDRSWFRDAFSSYLSDMNQVLGESFLGDINIERERRLNLDVIELYYRCKSIVEHPTFYPKESVAQAQQFIKDKGAYILKYIDWWNEQQGSGLNWLDPRNALNGLYISSAMKDILGRELGNPAFSAGLLDMTIDTSLSTSEILSQIDEYKKLSEKYILDRRDGYESNMQESRDIKKSISKFYQLKLQNASSNIFDLDNWLYRMPGQLGSSAASWLKTGIEEAAAVIAGIATSESGGFGYAATKAALLPMAYSAGEDEASANVTQNVGQRFKRNLESVGLWDEFKKKMSSQYGINIEDEELMLNAYMAGDRVAGHKIFEQYGDALHGVARSKAQDVAATTMDSFVELAVAATTIKGLPRSWARAANADGPLTKVLAPANPLFAAATKPVDKTLKNLGFYEAFLEITPTRLMPSGVRRKIAKLSRAVNPANYLSQKSYSNLKFIKDTFGRVAKTKLGAGYGEAIEEGKQQAIQEKFINGDYDWETAPYGIFTPSIILEDMNTGLDIASIALGIPLGIEYMVDADKIENMKGGFMGGGMHMSTSGAVIGAWDFNTQRKLNRDLAAYVDLRKQGTRGEILAAAGITKLAKYGSFNIDEAISRVKLYYENRDDQESAQAVDQKKDWLVKVASYATNPTIKQAAEKQGIDVNSDDYNTYVALIASHQIRGSEAKQDHKRMTTAATRQIRKKIDDIFGEMDEQGIYRPDEVSANMIQSVLNKKDPTGKGASVNREEDIEEPSDQHLESKRKGFIESDKARFEDLYTEALTLAALSQMHDEQTFAQYINDNKVVEEEGYRPSWNTASDDQKWIKRMVLGSVNEILSRFNKGKKKSDTMAYKDQLRRAREIAESFGDIHDLLAAKRAELYSGYQEEYFDQIVGDLLSYSPEKEEWNDLVKETLKSTVKTTTVGGKTRAVEENGSVEYNDSVYTIERNAFPEQSEPKPKKHSAKDIIRRLNDAMDQDRLLEEAVESEWLNRRWSEMQNKAALRIQQQVDLMTEEQDVQQPIVQSDQLVAEQQLPQEVSQQQPEMPTEQSALILQVPQEDREQHVETQTTEEQPEEIESDQAAEQLSTEEQVIQQLLDDISAEEEQAEMQQEQKLILDVEQSLALETQNDSELMPTSIDDGELDSFEQLVQLFIDHIFASISYVLNEIRSLNQQLIADKHDNDSAVTKTELQNAINKLYSIIDFSKQALDFTDEQTSIDLDILEIINNLIEQGKANTPNIDYSNILLSLAPIINKYIRNTSNWKNLTTIYKDQIEGKNASYCEGNKSIKLADVASNPDFILKAKFQLILDTKDGKSYPYMVVHYNGMKFTPMRLHTSGFKVNISINGKTEERDVGYIFFMTLKQIILNSGEGKAVLANIVRRTNGKIKSGGSLKSLFLAGFITEDQKFDVVYDSSGKFGLLRVIKEAGESHITVTANKSVLYTYTDPTTAMPGTLVYLLKRGYEEDGVAGVKVPVNINHSRLTEGDAQLVVDILCGKYAGDLAQSMSLETMLDQPFYQNGVNIGMTRRLVLNLILPYFGSHNELYSPIFVYYDNGEVVLLGTVTQAGVARSNSNRTPTKRFNITDEAGRKEMIKFLTENVDVHVHEWVLQSRLTDNQGMFGGIAQFMNDNQQYIREKLNGSLTLGNSRISFSLDDIRDLGKKDQLGISGVVWYAKNGYITTDFSGFEAPLLSVDMAEGFSVVDESELKSDNQQSQLVLNSNITPSEELAILRGTVDPVDIENTKIPDVNSFKPAQRRRPRRGVGGIIGRGTSGIGGEFADRQSNKIPKKRINVNEANKNLKRILGNNFVPEWFIDKVVAVSKAGANVLGRCWQDGRIFLSTLAADGTEFHEAFHRVSELLMTQREHDRLYKAYRRAYRLGSNVHDDDIAEMLADEFAFYVTGDEEFKISHEHKTLFDKIKYWTDIVGRWNSYKLHRIYKSINSGKYAYKNPTEETIKRFGKIFKKPYANVRVNGVDLDELFDTVMYRDAIDSLTYLLVSSRAFKYDGSDFKELQIEKDTIINSILYKNIMNDAGWYKENPVSDDTKRIITQLLDNFDAIAPDITQNLEQYSGTVRNINEQLEENASPEEDGGSAGSEQTYDRASYEISPFNRTSDKVKFFFSRILAGTNVRNGSEVTQRALYNSVGLPFFFDAKIIYNKALIHMCECRSFDEMILKAKELSERDGEDGFMFSQLYKRMQRAKEDVFVTDEKTGKKVIDWDNQALISLVYSSLRSTRNNFVTHRIRVEDTNQADHRIMLSDSDFVSYQFKQDWSDIFAHNSSYLTQDEDGKYKMAGNKTPKVFLNLRDALISTSNKDGKQLGLLYAFSDEGIDAATNKYSQQKAYTIRTRDYDGNVVESDPINVTDQKDYEMCKDYFVMLLNNLGIVFDKSNLNYYLQLNYGDTGWTAFREMLQSGDFQQFAYNLAGLAAVTYDSQSNPTVSLAVDSVGRVFRGSKYIRLDQFFNTDMFVDQLARAKYTQLYNEYSLQSIGIGRKRLYRVSENNTITDQIYDINRYACGEVDLQPINDHMGFVYNLYYDSGTNSQTNTMFGSIILKALKKKTLKKIHSYIYEGTKSDQFGDYGDDYASITDQEDALAKIKMLADGYMCSPTMSDKKTWMLFSGIDMPGLKYDKRSGAVSGMNLIGMFSDSALIQMLEYAKCEYINAVRTLNTKVDDDQKVDNYHKATACGHQIIPGARLYGLSAIVKLDGTKVNFNRVLDDSGNFVSEHQNLKKAYNEFFSLSEDELLKILANTLRVQAEETIQYCLDLGIISKRENSELLQFGKLDSKNLNAIYNQLVENDLILKRFGILDKNHIYIDDKQKLYDMAVRIYLADVSIKQNISIQEFDRLFAGHPAFYKTKYNDRGVLIDDTEDYQKRLGGLVSTGANNDQNYPGARQEYVAALVKDYKIVSKHLEEFKQKIELSEFKQALKDYILERERRDIDITAEDVDKIDDLDRIKALLPDNIKTIVLSIVDAKSGAFNGVNVTDGAAYISPQMCEDLLKSVGLFTNRVQEAFDILKNPKKSNSIYNKVKAYRTISLAIIGAQKYTAFGFRNQNGVQVPYYDKMALFPIFDSIAFGRTKEILDQMNKQGIDVIFMGSAVKLGGQSENEIDIDKPADQSLFGEDDQLMTYKQRFDRIRKQFNTDPKEKDTTSVGTQAQKIVYSSMRDNTLYDIQTGSDSKQSMNRRQVVDYCMQCINALSDLGKKEIEEKYFEDGKFKLSKFVKELQKDLRSRGAASTLIDQLLMIKGDIDPNTGLMSFVDGRKSKYEVVALPLVANSSISYIQSILVSEINKKVIDVNTAGSAFYQRSSWGTEGGPTVLRDSNNLRSLYGGDELLIVNEEGSMDCVLSIDFFEHSGMLPKSYFKDDNGEKLGFEQVRNKLISDGIIGKNATANIFGYRIPTQAVSSVFAFRCVDVIPVVRDAIIVPKEFTAVTGSDFDIDKIYLNSVEYAKSEDGNLVSDFDGENSRREYANKLIRAWISILKDSSTEEGVQKNIRSFGDMRGSIDSDTELIKRVLRDIESNVEDAEEIPYGHYSMVKSLKAKAAFIMAKTGIGPFALNNVNHVLTSVYGLSFLPRINRDGHSTNMLTSLNLLRLDKFRDKDGNKIFSWLSGFINAHVDVAKDPYITRLNVNKYTWNIINLLIRTGYGEDTLYFINIPVIRNMAKSINNMSNRLNKKNISKKLIECNTVIEQFDFLANYYDGKPSTDILDVITRYFKLKYSFARTDIILVASDLMQNKTDYMRSLAKGNHGKVVLDTSHGELLFSNEEAQLLSVFAFKDLSVQAQQLGDLVLSSKIDTKKQGKNIIEQNVYVDKFFDVFHSTKVFESYALDDMRDLSYINKKTMASIELLTDICSNISIDSQREFFEAIKKIATMCGINDLYLDAANKIRGAILGKIKAGYFFGDGGYCEKEGIDPRSLFVGKDSIYSTLLKLVQKIAIDPKYQDLKDASGNINNYLLNMLTSAYKFDSSENLMDGNYTERVVEYWNGAKFVKPRTLSGTDNFDEVEFQKAWEDLLFDDQHPDLQEFAKRLIVYAFMTSADNGGGKDIFRYVPLSWRTNPDNKGYDKSYAYYMERAAEEWLNAAYTSGSIWYDDIIINNWNDDSLVPKLNYSRMSDSFSANDNEAPKLISVQYSAKEMPPKYIKIVARKKCIVYRRIRGTGALVSPITRTNAVYVQIDPMGFDFGSKAKIYEYGLQKEYLSDIDLMSKLILNGTKFKTYIREILGSKYDISGKDLQTIIGDVILLHNTVLGTLTQLDIRINDASIDQNKKNEYIRLKANLLSLRDKILGRFGIFLDIDTYFEPTSDILHAQAVTPVSIISDKTERFGVLIINGSYNMKAAANKWQLDNPDGIVAYRKYGPDPKTFTAATVNEGWIGNPFSITSFDNKTVLQFYDWLVTGNDFGNNLATEEFRQAIIDKLMSMPEGSPILYYTELNRPSHATVLGYLINNKNLLRNLSLSYDESNQTEFDYQLLQLEDDVLNPTALTPNIPEGTYKPGELVNSKTVTPGPETKINIYAGTNENADLSNFAVRPFNLNGNELESVEQGFHIGKFEILRQIIKSGYTERDDAYTDIMNQITELQNTLSKVRRIDFSSDVAYGARLKAIGNTRLKAKDSDIQHIIDSFFSKTKIEGFANWEQDKTASNIMKRLLKESFEQNPQALKRLLATGNATLTHTQDKGKWGTEFPRILMEVRKELRDNNTTSDYSKNIFNDPNLYPPDEMNHCK